MRRAAVGFIVCIGFVSLFADVTYEGARSVSGPFLATLGAGEATVGAPLPRVFWIYTAGAALLGFGYADFSLIAYHAKRTAVVTDAMIPVLYSAAMGIDAVVGLALGWWFDRNRMPALITGAALGVLAAPLAFLGGWPGLVAGVALWGAGMGAQESVLRAAVAGFIPAGQRASAYGAFHAVGGVMWFAGSLAMGALYEHSLAGVAMVAVLAQLGALVTLHRAEMLHEQGVGAINVR